jgi:murein DD-endopeptidase MepM/ murein hydrolase activator NlpD
MRTLLVGCLMGSMLATGIDAVEPAPALVARSAVAATAGPAGLVAPPTGVAPRGEFGWPLPGFPTVLRPFDPPDHPYGPGHRGVDLGGWDGEPVLAAGAGVVVFAGAVAGRPVVSVDHPNGLRTTYEPVAATVAAGQHVGRGQPIGTLVAGHDGCPAAACLHWGVRRGDEYLDPLWLLAPGHVRLLPAEDVSW